MKRVKFVDFLKIVAILLFCSLLLLATLSISFNTALKNNEQWQVHYNEAFGFSIQFPGDWGGEIRQTYRYPEYMRAAFCSTCDLDSLHIYIWAVTDEDILANPPKWMRELVQWTDGYNLRRKSEATVGTKGYEASVWNFNEDVSFNIRTKSEAVLFVVGETVYIIEFTADERRVDEELPQFYEILATFEIAE